MGVCNLWNVLEPVKKQTSLSQLSGQTVAIDLGGLVVQSFKASQQSTVTGTFMMIRVLFYRILNLLKLGIKPLFVLDGSAPLIKAENLLKRQLQQGHSPSKSTERLKFQTCQEKCLRLLDALGIPYISSTGEAEKLCAILNNSQVVDACMTDDSDSFLYGAQTVYRNYEHNNKDTTIEVYHMKDVEENLNLNRRDLVAYALLAGCDYNETGVQGLGQTKSCTLLQDLKKSHPDVLERIQSWRQDSQLKALQKNQEKLREIKKGKHCSSCLHLGSKSIHLQKGCEVCNTVNDCATDNTVLCQCPWHHLHNQTALFATELGIRDKALRDDKFPDTRIIDEFLNDDGNNRGVHDIKWKVPNWRDLKSVSELYFRWNPDYLLKQVIPAVVYMSLHGILPLTTIKPLQIEKSCQDNFKACYQTQWSIQDDGWPNESDSVENYTIKTEKCLLQSKFPLIVKDFEKQQEEKEKQKSSEKQKKPRIKKEPHQMTMDKFFSSRKRLNFDSSSTSKKKKS
ncbi:flap endonuclease GEN homolog 1 [Patella vulgata]|uniref:flap endonuclease GEN homolog 1 n=1 Tax=Patella vulgata TaxID=6465 RepID=UPI0021808A41|nr:flap endonuclease GEN homolog 1 [Patella vulgata]